MERDIRGPDLIELAPLSQRFGREQLRVKRCGGVVGDFHTAELDDVQPPYAKRAEIGLHLCRSSLGRRAGEYHRALRRRAGRPPWSPA
jgi:hypothetical protein